MFIILKKNKKNQKTSKQNKNKTTNHTNLQISWILYMCVSLLLISYLIKFTLVTNLHLIQLYCLLFQKMNTFESTDVQRKNCFRIYPADLHGCFNTAQGWRKSFNADIPILNIIFTETTQDSSLPQRCIINRFSLLSYRRKCSVTITTFTLFKSTAKISNALLNFALST